MSSGRRPLPDWREEHSRAAAPRRASRGGGGEGEERERRRGPFYLVFYIFAIGAIIAVWVFAFRSYFTRYDTLHPEITWALPWLHSDTLRVSGVLLWDEQTVLASHTGEISYPMGSSPSRVYKGAVVAKIKSGGRVYEVKAPSEGYFIGGSDGAEGAWKYSEIWLSGAKLPQAERVKFIADGTVVKRQQVIGKMVPQPQTLRFIGLIEPTPELKKALDEDRVMVKMDELDSPLRAETRVFIDVDGMTKMYLSMPWFPPALIASRSFELMIETDTSSGVVVPTTALVRSGDERGAFVIKGSNAVFKAVKGRRVDSEKFLVTEGIGLGDAVIVNAENAREGKVNLW